MGEGELVFFSFIRRRDFVSKLIFDKLSEDLVIRVHSELVPSALENSSNKIKSDLTKNFEKRYIFLPIILQLSVTDKVRDARKQNFDVVNINFLG